VDSLTDIALLRSYVNEGKGWGVSRQPHARRRATPTAVVNSVIGTPIWRNSQNPMRACAPAISNTTTFATEPKRVRFSAKVEVRASSSHRR
jgi:hypothetical protein